MAAYVRKQYLALGFRDDETQEKAFLALVQHCIFTHNHQTDGERRLYMPPDGEVEVLIANFMQHCGPKLWPSETRERLHLAMPQYPQQQLPHPGSGAGKPKRSLIYRRDSRLRGHDLEYPRAIGRELTPEESLAYSKIGRRLESYFRMAAVVGVSEGAWTNDGSPLLVTVLSTRAAEEALEGGLGDEDEIEDDENVVTPLASDDDNNDVVVDHDRELKDDKEDRGVLGDREHSDMDAQGGKMGGDKQLEDTAEASHAA